MKSWKIILKLICSLLFCLCILGYAVIFTNDSGWALVAFVFLLGVVDLFTFISPTKMFSFQSLEHQRLHVGDPTMLTVRVRRKPWNLFYFNQVFLTFQGASQVPLVFSWHAQTIQLPWIPKQRGRFEQQTIELTFRDLFGFFERQTTVTLSGDWLVLPIRLKDSNRHRLQEPIRQHTQGEPSYLVKQYRTYNQGDALKNIDWKASSRQQTLIVREYERQRVTQKLFIFYGLASPNFEQLLSLYYTYYLNYRKEAKFVMIGSNLGIKKVTSEHDFVAIQPLKTLEPLPTFQEEVYLFVDSKAEVWQQVALAHSNYQVIDFERLWKRLGGGA